MVILGIDPGATGAIALYDTETKAVTVVDMPTVEIKRGKRTVREVHAPYLQNDVEMLTAVPGQRVYAYIEKVAAMPGQGVSSMFSFGRALGIVEGVLAALSIPVTFVSASVWTRTMGVVDGKDGSRKRASQMFPAQAEKFRRSKDDGRADAALIAAYGAAQQQL